MLWMVALSSVVWLVFTWIAGVASDRIGRKNIYLIGWVLQLAGVLALFPLVDRADLGALAAGLCFLAAGLGLTYGALSALYVVLLPASVRFSDVAVTHALGAILGGAFAPFIAEALLTRTHTTRSITLYLAGMTVLGLVATLAVRDRRGIELGPDAEEQTSGATSGLVFGHA